MEERNGNQPNIDHTLRRRGILLGGGKLAEGALGRLITHDDLAKPESCAEPFSNPDWIFELKYQGWRCLARHSAGLARLVSARGRDLSRKFPEVVKDIERLPHGTAIDGQLIIFDANGNARCDHLRRRAALLKRSAIMRAAHERSAVFIAWDALTLGGRDLRELPLRERKAALREALSDFTQITYAEHREADGKAMFAEAIGLGLEGVVAKRANAPYVAGPHAGWVKIERPRTEPETAAGAAVYAGPVT